MTCYDDDSHQSPNDFTQHSKEGKAYKAGKNSSTPAGMQQPSLGSLGLLDVLHLVFYRQRHFHNASCPSTWILCLCGPTLHLQHFC